MYRLARRVSVGVATLGGVFLLVSSALAQQTSAIAGVARDASGAVLPGVTVEASSPALIEKVRSAVTDGEGRYNIVDLRPGTYEVAFTLPGFSIFKRDGIVLSAGFTASVNADMRVGALEETITVSGEAPLVDTSNVRRQTVLSDEVLSVLPTGTKHVNTLVTLTPGLSMGDGRSVDVGGQYQTQVGGTYHGKGGTKTQFDGMGVQNLSGDGNTGYILNGALVEEMTLQTSGISAESAADGVLVNMIPKEGGNTFKGYVSGLYTNDSLQSDNLTATLRDRGLSSTNQTLKIYDATFTLGGRIKADKVWFFAALREWGNAHENAGIYWNKTQGTPFYTPDLTRPATRAQWYESHAARVTWQATQRNKFNFFADVQDVCICRSGSGVGQPPESALAYHFRPGGLYQAVWTAPIQKLLFEAGFGATINHWPQYLAPGVERQHISINDTAKGIRYNARATYDDPNVQERYAQRFSVSYVTGSHAFKTGIQVEQGIRDSYRQVNGDVNYTFRDGVPTGVTQYATPFEQKDRIRADMGIYVQDQWALHRFTLNLGLRFDYFSAYVPAQDVPAGQFGPARQYAEVPSVPLWKDLSPRLGAAYDLFGNGRTALKVSLGRYVQKTGVDIAGANNPIQTAVNSASRSWADTDGDFVPDCDLKLRTANGECGALDNQNFGGTNITTRWAEDVIDGFGVRGYNWDMSAEVQHQLGAGMSVTGGYYRNWYGNFRVTDNLNLTASDFNPYCITAPRDTRLPGGGGYQVCGLSDVNPAKFGQVNNVVTQASNFGKQTRVNDFVNLSFDTRFRQGVRLGGGIDTGRTVDDACLVVDSPQQLVNCRVVQPLKAKTELKLSGSYPLPAGFVVSAVYQNLPGVPYTADYAATTAEIAPSLGRPLAGGARQATVPLIEPYTLFEDRITRLDLRFTKFFDVGRFRVQSNLDIYNVANTGDILAITNAYGSRWRLPTSVIEGRTLQFGGQVSF